MTSASLKGSPRSFLVVGRHIRRVGALAAGTTLRHHLRMCQPTASYISREATSLSAKVSTQPSEFRGMGARGNM